MSACRAYSRCFLWIYFRLNFLKVNYKVRILQNFNILKTICEFLLIIKPTKSSSKLGSWISTIGSLLWKRESHCAIQQRCFTTCNIQIIVLRMLYFLCCENPKSGSVEYMASGVNFRLQIRKKIQDGGPCEVPLFRSELWSSYFTLYSSSGHLSSIPLETEWRSR